MSIRKLGAGLLLASALSMGAIGSSNQSSAADKNGAYSILRMDGVVSCADVVLAADGENTRRAQKPNSDQNKAYTESWRIVSSYVLGYLTAYNLLSPDTYDVAGHGELAGTTLWLTNYCRQNPTTDFADALQDFTLSNFPKRTAVGEG